MTDEESSSERSNSSDESDNVATDLFSIAEILEICEDYNEQYDEDSDTDSDLDGANSQVSAEQEVNRLPLGIPPIHHSAPVKVLPQLDQNLTPSVPLYTKILG